MCLRNSKMKWKSFLSSAGERLTGNEGAIVHFCTMNIKIAAAAAAAPQSTTE